jgi:predicted dehydrogenase
MTGARLRAGLSGCGGISEITLAAAANSPDFEVVAVQDPRAEALARSGDRFAIGARHREFAALLGERIDFVILCSPNDLHGPQGLAALDAGLHVLVQKPLAERLDVGLALVDRAEECGLRLGALLLDLGEPLWHEVRRMIADGWFGEITSVEGTLAHTIYRRDPPPADDWRRDPVRVGGGPFTQLASHLIHLLCWLLEDEIEAVTALSATGATVFEEDATVASVRFRSGCLGTITASYLTDGHRVTLRGTEGSLAWTPGRVVLRGSRPHDGALLRYDHAGEERALAAGGAIEPWSDMHARFARWIRDGEPYPSPGRSALEDLRVIAAVEESVRTGRRCVVRQEDPA